MEWTIYNVLYLYIETVQRDNISIIIKLKTRSFKWYIVCFSKTSLDKATRQRSELLDHPSYTTAGLKSLFQTCVLVLTCVMVSMSTDPVAIMAGLLVW